MTDKEQQDWESWDFATSFGPQEGSVAPPTAEIPSATETMPSSGEGASILDNAWASWGYASGELAQGIGMLMKEWLGWDAGAEFANNVGESAKAYHSKSIDSKEWERIRVKASEQFATLKEDGDWYKPDDWERGEADLESLFYMVVGAAPMTAATFPVAGFGGKAIMKGLSAFKGFKKLEKVSKIGKIAAAAGGKKSVVEAGERATKILNRIQKVAVGTTYGSAEGAISAGMTGLQIEESVAAMSIEDLLLKSKFAREVYDANIEEGMGHEAAAEAARESVRDRAVTEGMRKTFLTTAAFGAPTGMFLSSALVRTSFAKPFAKGKLRGLGKGFAGEAIEEGIQSPFEQYWQNAALQKYADETIKLSEGVFEAAVTGIVVGGVIGAPMGMAGTPTKARAKKIETEKEQLKDKKQNSIDNMKMEVHHRLASSSLMENHNKTPEEAVSIIDPILERFAQTGNIVEAISDLRHLEKTGRTREKGLDNVEQEENPEFGSLDVNIEDEAGDERNGHILPYASGSINGTINADGMNTDIIGPGTGKRIFIAEKLGKGGKFEQYKVLYGFESEEQALEGFYGTWGRDDADNRGTITEVTHEELVAQVDLWNKEYAHLGPPADEPLTPAEDLAARSDEDLQAGINDLKAQAKRFVGEEVAKPIKDRLKTLREEQRRRKRRLEGETKLEQAKAVAKEAYPTPETQAEKIRKGFEEGQKQAKKATKGHREDQPGLRGHSVGETYPFMVVGVGEKWAIQTPDGKIQRGRFATSASAQKRAGSLKKMEQAKTAAEKLKKTVPLSVKRGGMALKNVHQFAGLSKAQVRRIQFTKTKDIESIRDILMENATDLAKESVIAKMKYTQLRRMRTWARSPGQKPKELKALEAKAALFSLREGGQTMTGKYLPTIEKTTLVNGKPSLKVDFLHLSSTPDLQVLKRSKAGTAGTSRTRGDLIGDRIYIYAQSQAGMGGRSAVGNEPRNVKGPYAYSGTVDGLYDMEADPSGIRGKSRTISEDHEAALLKEGYVGWYWDRYPGVTGGMGVILSQDISAMYHGKKPGLLLSEPSMYQRLVTWETIPGKASPFYTAAQNLSPSELAEFHKAMLLGVIVQTDLRSDLLASAMGLNSRLLIERTGGYEGKVMPSMQVGLDTDLQADVYAQAIKIIYGQDAAPWMHAREGGKGHGLKLVPEAPVNNEQLESLQLRLDDNIKGGAGFTVMPDGAVVVVNFSSMTDKAFDKAVIKSARNTLPYVTIIPFTQDGKYNGEDQAKAKEIVHRAARKIGRPDLLQWANAAKARAVKNGRNYFETLPRGHAARQAYDRVAHTPFSIAEESFQLVPPVEEPVFSDEPFFSALLQTVEKAEGMPKQGAALIKRWLQGKQGLKRAKKQGKPDKKTGKRIEIGDLVPTGGAFTQEEADWMGLYEFLDSPTADAIYDILHTKEDVNDFSRRAKDVGPITRQDVQRFVRSHEVRIAETYFGRKQGELSVYDASTELNIAVEAMMDFRAIHQLPDGFSHTLLRRYVPVELTTDYDALVDDIVEAEKTLEETDYVPEQRSAQYAKWVLDGGENQRELVLTVPLPIAYEVGHYSGIDNIMVHIRFNDRKDVDGDNILFIEEVQSDLHQEGRKKGYAKPADTTGWEARRGEFSKSVSAAVPHLQRWDIYDKEGKGIGGGGAETAKEAIKFLAKRLGATGVPDAPFKKTWHMLAMKRMIRYAAENGYAGIGWTTGEQQNKRYDLAQYIDNVTYNPVTEYLEAYDDMGESVVSEYIAREELAEHIGQGPAAAMNDEIENYLYERDQYTVEEHPDVKGSYALYDPNGEPEHNMGGDVIEFTGHDEAIEFLENHLWPSRSEIPMITDLDEIVGGEGMIGFYDKMLVKGVNKFVKKWGGKVTYTAIETDEPFERWGASSRTLVHNQSPSDKHLKEITLQTANDLLGASAVSARLRDSFGIKTRGEFKDRFMVGTPSSEGEVDTGWYVKSEMLGPRTFIPQLLMGEDYRYFLDVGEQEVSGGEGVHYMDITPDMKKAAYGGFAMFSIKEQRHTKALYDRRDWTKINKDVDAATAGAMTPDEIQDAITEYALKGTSSKWFRRWFGKSKTVDGWGQPIEFYHGSPSGEIEEFKRSRDVSEYTHRNFVSLSTGSRFASRFSAYVEPDNYGKEFYDTNLKEYERIGLQSTVYPAYVRAEKLFDFRDKKMRRSFIRWVAKTKSQPVSKNSILAVRMREGEWAFMEGGLMQSFLKERGYDAFYMIEGGALNIGVFDPLNIKSSTGNAGTFSRATADTVYSLDPNQVSDELSRRLDLYQLIAHVERATTTESGPKAIEAHVQDGLERGLYSEHAVGVLKGEAKGRAKTLRQIAKAVRGKSIRQRKSIMPQVQEQEIRHINDGLALPPDFEVHSTIATLPDYVLRQLNENPDYQQGVEGFYDPFSDKVHIVASNIGSIEQLHRVYTEETLGHYGLRQFFGQDKLNGLLDDVMPNVEGSAAWKRLLVTYTHIADAIASDNPDEVLNGKRWATEELLAKQEVDQSVWEKFVAWFRAALREMGLITNYTENDIRRIMRSVHNRVIQGTTPHAWGMRNNKPDLDGGAHPYSYAYSVKPHPEFPYPEYAEEYPPIAEKVQRENPKTGKKWMGKGKSVTTEGVESARNQIWADMKAQGFDPYFDPEERHDVDPENYPPVQMVTREVNKPKTAATVTKHRRRVKTAAARSRLQEAYDAGLEGGYNKAWYHMGQLEQEFVEEYGEEEGHRQFYEKFVKAMAATTAGSTPAQNFLTSMFLNYLRNRGLAQPDVGIPVPIGAPYMAPNVKSYQQLVERGEGFKPTQPKGHNFAANFTGYEGAPTIDAQMEEMITPLLKKWKKIQPLMRFAYEELVVEMAEKNGVSPREFQEVSWGGYKASKSDYVGRPMIQIVNEAIERTHRLTGQPKEEVVKRGIVRSETPMFSISEGPVRTAHYTPARLQSLMEEYGYTSGFVHAAVITVNPDHFMEAATPDMYKDLLRSQEAPLDLLRMTEESQTPFLQIVRDGDDWRIVGHEGRHRMMALASSGVKSAPIVVRLSKYGLSQENKTVGLPDRGMLLGQQETWSGSLQNDTQMEFSNPVDISYNNISILREQYTDQDFFQTGRVQFAMRRPQGHEEELSIINEKIARAHSEMTVLDRVSNWLGDLRRAIQAGDFIWGLTQGTLDDAASVKRWELELFGELLDASVSPYKSIHTTKNLSSVMAAVAKVGIPGLVNGVFQPVEGHKGFIEIFRPLYEHQDGDLMDLWEGYAAARRASELIKQKNKDGTSREKLFEPGQIEKLLALGEEYAVFDTVFQDWKKFNQQLLDLAQEMGVLSEAEVQAWRDNDYVPFFRAMEEIEGVDQKVGWGQIKAGVADQRSGIKRLHGSEKMLGNITENMWFNTASLMDKIYKNNAMGRVVDMLEGIAMKEMPMPWEMVRVTNRQLAAALRQAGLLGKDAEAEVNAMSKEQKLHWNKVFRQVKPTARNVVGVMREGKMKYYEVEDEMLLSTLQGMGAEGLTGLMKAMGMSKSLLTRMVTLDPAFMLANWMRDTVSAWVTSDANFIPVVDSVRAMGSVFKEEGNYMRMMMSGAGGGGFYDMTGGKVSSAIRKELSHGSKHWGRSVWMGYKKLGAASENSNRLAIANRILAKGGTVAEAMYQAQDIMNFTMSGDYAAIKFLIRTVPFLNARMQGLYRLARGARDHPVGFTIKGAALMLSTLALLARNWDDDDYERLEPWRKDMNYNWFVKGEYFAFPRPFEIGIIFSTLPERLARLMLGRDDLAVTGKALARGLSETLAFNPVPQLFKPVLEEFANFNIFLWRDIENMSIQRLEHKYRSTPRTSQAAVRVGAMMPDWSGPLQSPLRIEHMVRAYTGTMGLYTMNAVDSLIRLADKDLPPRPERKWYEKPVLSRFIKGTAATARYDKYTQMMYDVIEESDMAQASLVSLIKQEREEEAIELAGDRRHLINTSLDAEGKTTLDARKPDQPPRNPREAIMDVRSDLRSITEIEGKIMYSKTMPAKRKRELLDMLNVTRHALLKDASEGVLDVLEGIEAGEP